MYRIKFFNILFLRIISFFDGCPLLRQSVIRLISLSPNLKKFIKKVIALTMLRRDGQEGRHNFHLRPELIGILERLDKNRTRSAKRQLFVDISEFLQANAGTGIQRLVYNVLFQLTKLEQPQFCIEPVYAIFGKQGYFYVKSLCTENQYASCSLLDTAIKFNEGDVFLGLDFQPQIVAVNCEFYHKLREKGVRVKFVVNDLLPVFLPNYFPTGSCEAHTAWLKVVAQTDGAICVSQAVADELKHWLNEQSLLRPSFHIDWFHLGADIEMSIGAKGDYKDVNMSLNHGSNRPNFLMVGTLEPRKGYAQALAAFELLWARGIDINLLIVGKIGWLTESLIKKIKRNPELNNRLFWFEKPSDEHLKCIYQSASCLIAASEGEGFGLPLIEAAQYKLPIIARDIPVFREVTRNAAFYFSGLSADELRIAIEHWLILYEQDRIPKTNDMPWLTWKKSTEMLMEKLSFK